LKNLVSIITPTFRADHAEIWRCVTSVLRQTYQNFEQIVASDGVHEHGTEQLVLAFRDSRVRYIVTEHHHGVVGNGVRHEVMMRHASGRYLVFLDDDNIIFPTYLEKMLGALATARGGEKFAICEILHFGPVQPSVGVPPLVLPGEPKLFHIDTLQVMVEAEAMRGIGWDSDSYHGDGIKYQELGARFSHVRVPECLCAHL
jgi:glycosyltransferase involved in cell wall biosynthesis